MKKILGKINLESDQEITKKTLKKLESFLGIKINTRGPKDFAPTKWDDGWEEATEKQKLDEGEKRHYESLLVGIYKIGYNTDIIVDVGFFIQHFPNINFSYKGHIKVKI